MSRQIEILNDVTHRNLRVRSDYGIAHPHFVTTVLNEFPAAASSCPIFFAKDQTSGEFYTAAMFGFEEGEVLVEGASEGRAMFQPLDLQRQGFFTHGPEIAVDTAHSRFGAGASIALFEDDGTPTGAMRKIQRLLGELSAGFDATRAFIQEMLRLKLIEPVEASLQFDDGRSLSLEGLYTISRDALNELPDEEIVALFRKGYMHSAMCVIFSLNQVAVLARRRNDRLTA